jgi:peptide/nickel transport system permease protein
MAAFILRRLTWAILVLVVVSSFAFLLTFVAPADPAKSIAGPNSSAAAVERIRVALGLDRPPLTQLLDYFGSLIQGDLGVSFKQGGVAVLDLILAKLPATIELAFAGLFLAIAIGVPLGVASAVRPGSILDRVGALVGSFMISVPSFLLGLVFLYFLAYQWHLFPLATTEFDPFDLRALALPSIALALGAAPFYLRLARATMLDELHHDYVRTARAKGLPEERVVWHHAFRNAMPPLLTQAGLDMGFFLGGVVVVESVFSWPGIGQQAVKAITREDLPVLMGTLLFATLCIVLANLVVDVLYAVLDPRTTHWRVEA